MYLLHLTLRSWCIRSGSSCRAQVNSEGCWNGHLISLFNDKILFLAKHRPLKNLVIFLSCFTVFATSYGQQSGYWQQQADFVINVSLNDSSHTLDGNLQMTYHNNSPDTLSYIWIHLWPNAYKNDKTAFSEQLLINGRTDFYFTDEENRGFINRLNYKVDDVLSQTEDHSHHQDIIKLILPEKLLPAHAVKIETPFHVKLPYNFSRGGHIGNSYQVTQWYPKPAVYDRKGWHPMPYLDQGEFYSDFGNYTVNITVPSGYLVAATGKMARQEQHAPETLTYTYKQDNVHDFAWFADKEFEVLSDTIQMGGRVIHAYAYYHRANKEKWQNSLQYIKRAVMSKSRWLGEYPYETVSVVEKEGMDDGGMEYPTITLVSSPLTERSLDNVINHEVGHNWFYGILATNERTHPWMDEGMNSYYDYKYNEVYYHQPGLGWEINGNVLKNKIPQNPEKMLLHHLFKTNQDQPVETSSADFNKYNYNLVAYSKTAYWLKELEKKTGPELFDSIMKVYYERWKFRHPYPDDFKAVAEEVSAMNLDEIFQLLHQKGFIAQPKQKKLKPAFIFNLKEWEKYQYISFLPAAGYNQYDKLMLGAIVHNYQLPRPNLSFVAIPVYAVNSKQLKGIGNINHVLFTRNKISKLVAGFSFSSFSTKESIDTFGNKLFENSHKYLPYLKVYFRQSPLSSATSWIDLRTFVFHEEFFDGSSYVVKSGSDSSVFYPTAKTSRTRYLNQATFNYDNNRALYPYNYKIGVQQGDGFYRINTEGNYFFNYTNKGGLQARIYASKFGYIGGKNFYTYRYRPKLLAPTGEDDYTYSGYFIGRSASAANPERPVNNNGLAAQQVMIDQGGLKLRLDQYDYLQGRSDNWIAALNFNTTLPDLFPIRIPFRLFLDIGTYAEAWEKDPVTSKFLYVGGLQLSLFKNLFNIYAPLVYNKDFRSVFKGDPELNTFSKRLTFSIELQRISLNKLFPQIAY